MKVLPRSSRRERPSARSRERRSGYCSGSPFDEHKHAELAWDTLAWTLTRAPDEVRAVLRSISEYERSDALETQAPPGLERCGRLPASELARISQHHAAESGKRLARLLSA